MTEPEIGERIRVVVADDHASFRSGLRAVLTTAPDLEIVGEASTGLATLAASRSLQPDVIVMDINMPDLDGIEATRRIVADSPHVAVIMLTMYDDDDSVFDALRAGARGYVLKGASRVELVRAIRAVASGGAILGPALARRLAAYFDRPAPGAGLAFPELTGREREVLDGIARGHSNAEIAGRLSIAPKTVRNQVSTIFSKLQVRDRAEAIVRAREAGLGGGRSGAG